MDPDLAGAAPALVNFQIREQGLDELAVVA
jgi:hypothetical protein